MRSFELRQSLYLKSSLCFKTVLMTVHGQGWFKIVNSYEALVQLSIMAVCLRQGLDSVQLIPFIDDFFVGIIPYHQFRVSVLNFTWSQILYTKSGDGRFDL